MHNIKLALASLAAHRLRAILAMLGVFLGALVLTAILHISQAMILKADLETQKLGPNLVQAVAGQVRFGGGGSARVRGLSTTFTLEDAEVLGRQVPWVKAYTSYTNANRSIKFEAKATQTQVVGTLDSYPNVRTFFPQIGRFFNALEVEEKAKVVVLGSDIAKRLFTNIEDAIGKTVLVQTTSLKVIGVMESKGQDLSGSNQDEQVFVPITTYMRRMNNIDYISGVYFTLYNAENEQATMETMRNILRKRHNIKNVKADDFSVFSARDASKLRTEALNLVQTLGFISATVSFAVGSLGILSVMILLVRARRLEIGIRRAVGASAGNIVSQFLTEAAIMSGVGGILGVFVAVILCIVIYILGNFPFYFNVWLCILLGIASIVLGVVAGAYPAWVASKVQVLDVLKNQE
ncbi:ABC transporter permease [Desulfovibrio litoralis]|uniref:Putative ABC transport system permease protein n=1 Tax=Desulfovibrio litoralis DSM 11393 TaxID=1121455 RepID=A0A1M7RRH3_9BACT|nr:ABC transporter permease [Desulfovibrio litoralis]SHN48722.1 putative ABC transport system permease protein [Desulfovibrio litoralis DSM 11393]